MLSLGTLSIEAQNTKNGGKGPNRKRRAGKQQRDKNPKQKGGEDSNGKRRSARTERCLNVGEKCPKTLKHGKKKRKHTCEKGCCTRYAEIGSDGTRRCACKPTGSSCSPETAR